jgi:hypothetical protein
MTNESPIATVAITAIAVASEMRKTSTHA